MGLAKNCHFRVWRLHNPMLGCPGNSQRLRSDFLERYISSQRLTRVTMTLCHHSSKSMGARRTTLPSPESSNLHESMRARMFPEEGGLCPPIERAESLHLSDSLMRLCYDDFTRLRVTISLPTGTAATSVQYWVFPLCYATSRLSQSNIHR